MPKTRSTYHFTIDWEDRGLILPYGHSSMVSPIDGDFDQSLSLYDIHNPVGLRGNFDLDDPDHAYDPAVYAPGSPERVRLGTPHRFWHYRINSLPEDFSVRLTGYVVLDRRPDKNTARFKLLPLEFVQLRKRIRVPTFNTYQIPPTPVIRRPAASASVSLRGVLSDDFTELNVIAALTNAARATFSPLQLADGSPIHFRVDGGEITTSPLASGVANKRIDVIPGSTVNMETDVQETFLTAGVRTFTIGAVDAPVVEDGTVDDGDGEVTCLLYTSPSPRDS